MKVFNSSRNNHANTFRRTEYNFEAGSNRVLTAIIWSVFFAMAIAGTVAAANVIF